jgi:hypothetical protein
MECEIRNLDPDPYFTMKWNVKYEIWTLTPISDPYF